MKNIYIYFIMLAAVLACSEEFTESVAVGSFSDESLQNETGVNLKLTGAYSALDGIINKEIDPWYASGDNWWLDVLSDDAHKGSTDGDQADLYQLETYDWSTGNQYLLSKWEALFAGVNRANAVIVLIAAIEEGDFSNQLAEARFLRGHFNFELQKIFGKIPYISEENYANSEFNQPNPGPIWNEIEADFQYAIDNLPPSQDEQPGRPTSWVAKSYLGKVHLQQNEWSEAATLLNEVVNKGPYSLMTEFVDNFRLAGENSLESVFAIQFTIDGGANYDSSQGGTLNYPAPGPFGSCCGFYMPSQDLVNAFQVDASGLPLLDTFNQSDVANDYGINSNEPFSLHTGTLDPRLDYTVGRRGIDYNGYGEHVGKDWIGSSFADISGPYLPKKNVYHSGESENQGTGDWGQNFSGINYHVIRFADVLLMAAEAAVETNDLGTALTNINRIRSRAKNMTYVKEDDDITNAANYSVELYASFGSQDYARKAVRMERRLELSMEGHRLFDIRRYGNGEIIMNEYFVNEGRAISSFEGKSKPYQAKHNNMPIPLNAIDLSGNILDQHTGF